jgi:hypothetical protein
MAYGVLITTYKKPQIDSTVVCRIKFSDDFYQNLIGTHYRLIGDS